MLSMPIYSRDANGRTRSWQFEVEGDKWRTHAGLLDGQKAVSGWTTATPKNVGKKNATTADEQAFLEATAELHKKLDRDYRDDIAALDSVPPSPMLAQDFGKQKTITYPVCAQPKLDGIRALITSAGPFSRQYQPHFNCAHIVAALEDYFAKYPTVALDGELYNHALRDDFNTITSVVRKQKVGPADAAKAAQLIEFHCYDMFDSARPDMPFTERMYNLIETLPAGSDEEGGGPGPVKLVPTKIAYDKEHLDRLYASWLEAGYEGQMVRLRGPYEVDKRSKLLLKRKEFITDEFEIVDIQEGNGNWAGYAKRVVVRLADGSTNDAGMRGTQDFARDLLANKADFIGGQATLRYFGVTPDGKLRMPVAIDFHTCARVD